MYPQIVKASKDDAYKWIIQSIGSVEANQQPLPYTIHTLQQSGHPDRLLLCLSCSTVNVT